MSFELPRLQCAADTFAAMAAITAAVAAGEIVLGEVAELAKLVDAFVKAIEANEFDPRLRAWRCETMRSDLRCRLKAAETRRCRSPRVAAIVRAIKTISAEELARQGSNPTGLFDPVTLSDGELQWLIGELELLRGDELGQMVVCCSSDSERPVMLRSGKLLKVVEPISS